MPRQRDRDINRIINRNQLAFASVLETSIVLELFIWYHFYRNSSSVNTPYTMRVSPLLSLPIALLLATRAVAEGRTAAEAAADGNRLLAQGAYSDAARAYSDAIGV